MKKYFFWICIVLSLFGTYTWVYGSSSNEKLCHVVAFGDSITHGSGDPSKKGYIERVKVNLAQNRSMSVHISNFGVPKYTTEDILKQLKDDNVKNQLKKANYIILYIGTNDFRKSAQYKFNKLNLKKIYEGKLNYSGRLHKIFEIIRNENTTAPVFILGLYHPYVEYENQQEIQRVIEEWNDEIIKVSSTYNQAYFVPTLDLFNNRPKEKLFSDSLHPNPAGYQQISKRLIKYMTSVDRLGNRDY